MEQLFLCVHAEFSMILFLHYPSLNGRGTARKLTKVQDSNLRITLNRVQLDLFSNLGFGKGESSFADFD
jgi:hypothetical protein